MVERYSTRLKRVCMAKRRALEARDFSRVRVHKRNIHFYVNKCGFQIDEFWCEYFQPDAPMPEDDHGGEGPDEMFRFIKIMKNP